METRIGKSGVGAGLSSSGYAGSHLFVNWSHIHSSMEQICISYPLLSTCQVLDSNPEKDPVRDPCLQGTPSIVWRTGN